jgi:galactokinase
LPKAGQTEVPSPSGSGDDFSKAVDREVAQIEQLTKPMGIIRPSGPESAPSQQLESLRVVGKLLQRSRKRKPLVWITGSFAFYVKDGDLNWTVGYGLEQNSNLMGTLNSAYQSAIDSLNDGHVSLYPFYVWGHSEDGLRELATRTGGSLLHYYTDSTDFPDVVSELCKHFDSYYMLTLKVQPAHKTTWIDSSIKINKPDTKVNAAKGFFSIPQQADAARAARITSWRNTAITLVYQYPSYLSTFGRKNSPSPLLYFSVLTFNFHPDPEKKLQTEQLKRRFLDSFGITHEIFSAPGRINLIGEHTDYNDGFVMPAAIDFHTWVAVARRDDRKVVAHSEEWKETAQFNLDDVDASPKHHWLDYVRGVAIQLKASGYALQGCNLAISSDVPMGAGLSSSAALEVASALALIHAAGCSLEDTAASRVNLAKLCQRAENETVGARVGIMDQFASINGRAGHALLLDCRSLEFTLLPLPEDVSFVICNTMVRHSNSGGEYNVRRSQCEEGVRLLAASLPRIRALRDVSEDQLEQYRGDLPETIFRRCRHVIAENARTLSAAKALRSGQITQFGELMYESHRSLRDDYEVSCAELDIMVELASDFEGTYGARMMGGGFGGCTINLVEKGRVEDFKSDISRLYEKKTGIRPEIYVTSAANGASAVTA